MLLFHNENILKLNIHCCLLSYSAALRRKLIDKGGIIMLQYRPEGMHFSPPETDTVIRALSSGEILQALCVKCDESHNLYVDLGEIKGVIPREETAAGKIKIHAIMKKVGKPICFQVIGIDQAGNAILSRKAAQETACTYFHESLRPGDVIPIVIQNPTQFGVFCDIGCGVTALMRIGRCCVSRLENTAQLYEPGQTAYAAVLQTEMQTGRIELTGRELLGTWEENAALFRSGQTVTGTVRSILPYGVFIELTPNLSGLAEPQPGLSVGDRVSIYIRSIQPEKHKIKLSILEVLKNETQREALPYFITEGHLDRWEYYPGSRTVTYF